MLNTLHINNSPFSEPQLDLLKQGFDTLDATQAQWLSGYLAGLLAASDQAQPIAVPAASTQAELTILYGSETGNGEALANALSVQLQSEGVGTKLASMESFRPAGLKKLKHAVFVISTHGEGDPPDEALDIFEFLDSKRAPQLNELNYRILALGDRSYSFFCAAGIKLDERLQKLGAKAFGERIDCDVDYDKDADLWRQEVAEYAKQELKGGDLPAGNPASGDHSGNLLGNHLSIVPRQPRWTRQQPFEAEVLRLQKITGEGSGKDVYHLELSLEDSGLAYLPGDALGIWAPNDPELINDILQRLSIDVSQIVNIDEDELSVFEALQNHREITKITADTIISLAETGNVPELKSRFDALAPQQQREFIEQRQFADLILEFPAQLSAQALVDLLRPLGPRSYSIASSPSLVDEEVHLTVATHFSDALGVQRTGVASQFLNHRVAEGSLVKVFPEPNTRFHLPENPDTPIIMIAAGTGIAPFRAFMQELQSRKSNGNSSPDSWLIFGNPHLRSDFLYQKEWLQWRENEVLNRIDVAFSRDQKEKIYVQHIVEQQATDIAQWLERGASVYICGALSMGQSVQDALQAAIAQQHNLDEASAAEVMADLRRSKRIHKDLY